MAPQSADLWVGEVLLRDDNARQGTGDCSYVGVRAFKATTLEMIIQLDDLVLDDAITFVGPAPGVTWAGFKVDEDGWADTGAWMDWMFVGSRAWTDSLILDGWMYLPEEKVHETGAWVFAVK